MTENTWTIAERSSRRRFALGAAGALAAAVPLARTATAKADSVNGPWVAVNDTQPADTFLPVFLRNPQGRPATDQIGFQTGTIKFNNTVDPFVAMGYWGANGDYSSTWQLEGDWDTGPGDTQPHITELYWQIIRPDGAHRRPFYAQYDRTAGLMSQFTIMIGPGNNHVGVPGGQGFTVNWDDGTNQVGRAIFHVKPAYMQLMTTGATGQTMFLMHALQGFNAALHLFSGQTAADSAYHRVYANGNNLLSFDVNGKTVLNLFKGAGGQARASLGVSDNTAAFTVATNEAAVPALVARRTASQSAKIVDVQDENKASLWSIDKAGVPRWSAANMQTTVGAAGNAANMPAHPTTYLKVQDANGNNLVIPAYAAS